MLQVGNRKLADPEIPVGMPRPFHVEIIAPIKSEFDVFALEFIDKRRIRDGFAIRRDKRFAGQTKAFRMAVMRGAQDHESALGIVDSR